MGLSIGPQSFAPLNGEAGLQAVDGQTTETRPSSPLDPLVAALSRAVERSAGSAQRDETRRTQGQATGWDEMNRTGTGGVAGPTPPHRRRIQEQTA